MFSIKVEGLESLQKEFDEEFMPRVNKAVTAGLKAVASDLTASLGKHIQEDVYGAYEPKVYRRRMSNGGMSDAKNITTNITGQTLTLDYSFDTETPVYYKDGKPEYTWAWYKDSDDVIRAIQTNKSYPTAHPTDECEPRPFWNNFVTDNFINGKAEISFVKAMNTFDGDLKAVAEKKNLTDGSDADSLIGLTVVPSGATDNNHDAVKTSKWDDEDLPF